MEPSSRYAWSLEFGYIMLSFLEAEGLQLGEPYVNLFVHRGLVCCLSSGRGIQASEFGVRGIAAEHTGSLRQRLKGIVQCFQS